MGDRLKDKVTKLLSEVSLINCVSAIGQTGDADIEPKPGESDIDIFVLGDKIPSYEERKAVYDKNSDLYDECTMNVCEGGDWGTGDVFIIDGVDTMLMYFTTDETLDFVNQVLEGRYLDINVGFYPIGRCATLKNINVIYDEKEILRALKQKLDVYPDELRGKMIDYHFWRTLDEEGLGRSLLRKEVLYYHQVLEAAIDHYLQTLYAVNRVFFPSRKRIKKYIDSFEIKPSNCYERLMEVIKLGSCPDDIEKSCSEWRDLVSDLKSICYA